MNDKNPKQAVILAAGKGVRMLHLTKDTPKPLIKIQGKPYLAYLLNHLKDCGFKKVILVVHYLKEKIQEFVDESNYPFEIELVDQEKALGTGHAVLVTKNHISGNFVVINGDNLFSRDDLLNVDFDDDYNYVFGQEHPDPKHYGVLKVKGDFLVELEEKPEHPSSNLINVGLYKFTPEIFDVLEKIESSPRGEYELTSAIDILAKQGKFKVKILKSYCVHLGKLEDVEEVEEFIQKNL